MSSLETSKVSYFEEKNMIDFLETYEDFCDDYELNQIDRFRKLSRYCDKIINDSIKTMIKYIDFNWQELKKTMKKKYKKDDTDQQLNSWIFLKIFKNKSCIMKNDLKLYSQQYKSISHSLIKRKQMNEYIRCCWFVKSLSSILSEKIIRKCALNSEDLSFMNFKKASDAIVIYCDFVKALLKFLIMIKNFDDLSKLVDEYQIKRSTMSDKFFNSSIVAQFSNTTMNEMINKFETMMLSLQTATKKIESFMQNMTASVSMLNVYILRELVTSARSAMLMLSSFSLSKSKRASSMFRIKECFFCEEIECQKIKCRQLNIYKIEKKIHVNETNRLWIKLVERSDRLTSFALSRSQKQLIDNALKKQSQQMKAKHVDIIRLTSVRAMITKKAENTDEKQKWDEEVMIVTARYNYKSDENVMKTATQQRTSSNWTWREKVRKEEHLLSMKNLRSEEYLLISKMFSKKQTSENVIMQNAAALKKTVKTTKKLTKKNSDDSKIKSDNQDKRTQNIVEECINTENVMHIIMNKKMQGVSIEQMLTHSSILLRALYAQVKQHKKMKMKKTDDMRVTAVKFEDSSLEKSNTILYAVTCSRTWVLMSDEIYIKTLLDNDAEINIMSETLVARAQLSMQRDIHLDMIEVSEAKTNIIECCNNVKIDIDEAKSVISIFVIKSNEYTLILSRSYERKTRLCINNTLKETCEMTVIDNDERMMFFKSILTYNSVNRDVLKIFLEKAKNSLNE